MIASVSQFIVVKLKLKVNSEKSAVARPWIGSFWVLASAGIGSRTRIAWKATERFKQRVRELTSRHEVSLRCMTKELSQYLRGWRGYFGNARRLRAGRL